MSTLNEYGIIPECDIAKGRELDALRARVAALEADEARLRYLANEPVFDGYAGLDLHEEASICAEVMGREEANSDDYLAAIRTLIDTAMRGENGNAAAIEGEGHE